MTYRVTVSGLLTEDLAQSIAGHLSSGVPDSVKIEVAEGDGEMGLSYSVAGSVAQALGAQAVDRGVVTREQVKAYLASERYDEDELWTVVGPLIDQIEDAAGALE